MVGPEHLSKRNPTAATKLRLPANNDAISVNKPVTSVVDLNKSVEHLIEAA